MPPIKAREHRMRKLTATVTGKPSASSDGDVPPSFISLDEMYPCRYRSKDSLSAALGFSNNAMNAIMGIVAL